MRTFYVLLYLLGACFTSVADAAIIGRTNILVRATSFVLIVDSARRTILAVAMCPSR